MRALVFENAGAAEDVLRCADVPEPAPRPGYARVDVTARPLQPADRFFIAGSYRIVPEFPQIAGLEGAGIIRDISGDAEFRAGRRVAFRWPGTWAETTLVPFHRLLPVPDAISDDVAAQISLNPITAWAVLREADLREGDWLIATAASSTVARIIATLARIRGIRTIGIVRSASKTADLFDQVFASDDAELAARIADVVGDGKIEALVDSVGGPLLPLLIKLLTVGARIVTYGAQDPRPAEIFNSAIVYRNVTWSGFGIDRWLTNNAELARRDALPELLARLASGEIALPVKGYFELERFADALAAERDSRPGKILLR